MRRYTILFAVIFGVSCQSPKTFFDYDQSVDFSSYSSFGFMDGLDSGFASLDEGRFLNELEKALINDQLHPSENPDLLVNVMTEIYLNPNRNRIGLGVGGGGGNVGVGLGGSIPIGSSAEILRITIDFIDAGSKELVWQGVVESAFEPDMKPEEKVDKFSKLAEVLLRGYPPEKD